MEKQQVYETISRVVAETLGRSVGEIPLDVPVESSAKHVHLTGEAVRRLFGEDARLTPKRPLSQPGQFLSEERLRIVTPKGELANVAVLGPERDFIQVELSTTDCRVLGIDAPVRMSGDLSGAADVYLVGPKGMIPAPGSAIVAKAHIHMTPQQAQSVDVADGERMRVTVSGGRRVTFEGVEVRVSPTAGLAMHIDLDEANACLLPKGGLTIRMRRGGGWIAGPCPGEAPPAPIPCQTAGGLITEARAKELASGGKELVLDKSAILTPLARDVFLHAGITVKRGETP